MGEQWSGCIEHLTKPTLQKTSSSKHDAVTSSGASSWERGVEVTITRTHHRPSVQSGQLYSLYIGKYHLDLVHEASAEVTIP